MTTMTLPTTGGRIALCHLFKDAGFIHGAEIGVWKGQFSKQLCDLVPGLHLLAVDPWQSYAEYQERKNDQARLSQAYREARRRLEHSRCTIMRMASVEAAEKVGNGSLDFVYLDGNHAEAFVTEDLAHWVPKVRTGGIVAGHDYVDRADQPWIQVKLAIDAYADAHGVHVQVLTGDPSPSWYWVVV